jgi:hypothetical protein
MIMKLHPTDPNTNEKFEVLQSVTVSNYLFKLFDACGCISLYKIYKLLKYKFWNWMFPKKRNFVKPITMEDVPSSDSVDSEANDTFKGLSNASIYLGEGAILYLQTMKTLAILFFVLSLINIPIFIMYSKQTHNNQYEDVNQVFKYFTLGNIAQTNKVCGYSQVLNTDFGVDQPDPDILP